jgi:hypothetical protein
MLGLADSHPGRVKTTALNRYMVSTPQPCATGLSGRVNGTITYRRPMCS